VVQAARGANHPRGAPRATRQYPKDAPVILPPLGASSEDSTTPPAGVSSGYPLLPVGVSSEHATPPEGASSGESATPPAGVSSVYPLPPRGVSSELVTLPPAGVSSGHSSIVPADIRQQQSSFRGAPPSALNQPSIDYSDQGQSKTSKAWEIDFDVAVALLRSLNSRVGAPTYLANVATQGETAYALEAPERLLDFIRQVQERDKAFPGTKSLMRREAGGAVKGQHH
jgi:hypothetical protein